MSTADAISSPPRRAPRVSALFPLPHKGEGASAWPLQPIGMAPVFAPLLSMVATWDSWRWYAGRVAATPDEALPLLLAVLFLAVLALPRLMRRTALQTVPLFPLAALLALYAVATALAVPPILRAAIAALAVMWALYRVVFGRSPPPAFYGLVALALPVVPSLQFVLGYPMRLVSAVLTVGLLNLQGLPILRQGTYVVWQGEMAQFDAPCSGVNMMWALVLMTLMLSLLRRFSISRTLMSVLAAVLASIAANVLRVASLLILGEAGTPGEPLHEAIGIVAFMLAAALLMWGLLSWKNGEARSTLPELARPLIGSRGWQPVAIAALAAAGAPLMKWDVRVASTAPHGVFPGWPQTYEGQALTPLPMTERETAFAREFPGRIGRFSDGRREIILRWLSEPTRRLHPASDCFRGIGYSIDPLPLKRNATGQAMGCFRATRHSETRTICEGIYGAAAGASWSDVSAWYWETIFSGRSGPWWSVVVAE